MFLILAIYLKKNYSYIQIIRDYARILSQMNMDLNFWFH